MAPNPWVNASTPVRVCDLASTCAGAPVTLIRQVASIALTAGAIALIREVSRASQFRYPALRVGQIGQTKDLARMSDGAAQWRVVRNDEWFIHILGASDPPSSADVTPFAELPALVLHIDSATSALAGTLTIDARNGQLEVTSIGTQPIGERKRAGACRELGELLWRRASTLIRQAAPATETQMLNVLYVLALLVFAVFGTTTPGVVGIAIVGAAASTAVWLVLCLRRFHNGGVAEFRAPGNDVGESIGADGGGNTWNHGNGAATFHDGHGHGGHSGDHAHEQPAA